MPSQTAESARLLDRLRAGLAAAQIPATEADFATIAASDFLPMVAALHHVLAAGDHATVPDFLADWGPATDSSPVLEPVAAHTPAPPAGHALAITAMAPLIRTGQRSPVELTEEALAKIEAREATLNAFQLVLPDRALVAARRAEEEIHSGHYRGPLHGIPVAVKDLLAMRDTVTTAGSKIFANRITHDDAAAVARLEAAGAIIVGKTRLSEFAYWPGSSNAHYGPTRNPRNLAHDTGGSSSGSAAAVADGIVFAALGSDTGGSIRVPATYCGLVGLKPTFGRVSLHGCASLSWSLDHLGPLTRTVEDTALVLAALAGHDPRDPRTRAAGEFRAPADLESGARGLRIGVVRDDGSGAALGTPAALAAWEAALRSLEAQGAVLEEVNLPEMEALRLTTIAILAVEAAAYHAPLMRTHLDDYGAICRERLVRAFTFSAADFVQAQQARQSIRAAWDSLFDRLDLISTPAQPDVAPRLDVGGSVKFTNPFNGLGWPAITVPAGEASDGLPFGIQLVGKPWDEATVLRAARAVEDGA
jgi:aspartyl-tRNA(Asn)/glutamyl-tRNA(Gln) amidotransferase subunit A